jgi:hypothetical protein
MNLCWGLGTQVQAQGYFNFGYGLGVNLTSFDGIIKPGSYNPNEQITLSGKFTKVNIVYVPRYQFLQLKDDFGLGIASYVELGMSFYTLNQSGPNAINNDWDNSRTGFQVGVPLLIEAAYGAGSTEDSDQPFGLFVGGGIDLQYNVTKDEDGIPGFVYGPTVGGGVRFGIVDNYMSIRTAYSIPMVDHWKNQFTIQVLFHFY